MRDISSFGGMVDPTKNITKGLLQYLKGAVQQTGNVTVPKNDSLYSEDSGLNHEAPYSSPLGGSKEPKNWFPSSFTVFYNLSFPVFYNLLEKQEALMNFKNHMGPLLLQHQVILSFITITVI